MKETMAGTLAPPPGGGEDAGGDPLDGVPAGAAAGVVGAAVPGGDCSGRREVAHERERGGGLRAVGHHHGRRRGLCSPGALAETWCEPGSVGRALSNMAEGTGGAVDGRRHLVGRRAVDVQTQAADARLGGGNASCARFWAAPNAAGAFAGIGSRRTWFRRSVPDTSLPTLISHSPRRSSVVGAW